MWQRPGGQAEKKAPLRQSVQRASRMQGPGLLGSHKASTGRVPLRLWILLAAEFKLQLIELVSRKSGDLGDYESEYRQLPTVHIYAI